MAPAAAPAAAPQLVAVPFGDIGKNTKSLFDTKAFPSDTKVAFSGKTSSGVSFTTSALLSSGKVAPNVKAAYTAASKKYSLEANYESAEKITVTGSLLDVAPRLKLTGSVVLPSYADSAKATVEYSFPALSIKSTLGLTSSPTVDLAAATSYSNLLVGAEASYCTTKSAVTKYTFAAAYHGADHQVAATVSDKLSTLRVAYAHNITATQAVGAEVIHKLDGGATNFALGYTRKLDSALTRFRLDNSGALSIGYETKLAGGEKVVGSLQLNTTDLNKAPKYGFALDLF